MRKRLKIRRSGELISKMGESGKVVIPEVVIGNPAVEVKNWVPDNDFGNDDFVALTCF